MAVPRFKRRINSYAVAQARLVKFLEFGCDILSSKYAMYLTVLPFYRQSCIEILKQVFGDELSIYAGPRQTAGNVRTGISSQLYTPIRGYSILNKVIIHTGSLNHALRATNLIVDLNPRCLTAWGLLLVRKSLRKRSIVWGHLLPRAGAGSRTAVVRRAMRRLADATLLYGYDSVIPAREDLPGQPVWVAPNALYRQNQFDLSTASARTKQVIYVGRLVSEKKVDLLIRAFSEIQGADRRLLIVGDGPEALNLQRLAHELGISQWVDFLGQISEAKELAELYAGVSVAVSPGYAGLSLTQSLGFGVPVLVADEEPHAPEIELERFGGVTRFRENSYTALANAMKNALDCPFDSHGSVKISAVVRGTYSAEAMASGITNCFQSTSQVLGPNGWPTNV